MDLKNYCGAFYMMGFLLHVRENEGQLGAAVAGTPDEYEIRLEDLGEDRFRMHGGPADGSTVEFIRGTDGRASALRIGNFELSRVPPEKSAELPAVERLTIEPPALTPEMRAAFDALLEAILKDPTGKKIDYALDYPKHYFVQYVMNKDMFIFHGSNNRSIEVFNPVRTSVELFDRSGSGNLQAVYGTHDGLWAMFFAIVDRGRLKGSIRNGVMYLHNQTGEALAVYNFSVNQAQLAERPWTEGALYLLPRENFHRQRLTEESYSNEWASVTPVRPVARLDVVPEDFPFLDRIGGHDDEVLMRGAELGKRVREAAVAASLEGARFSVRLPNRPGLAQVLADWAAIQSMVIPAARIGVEKSVDGLTCTMEDLPPAYQQVMREEYSELLKK